MSTENPVIFLLGPTASGKTGSALMLAQHLPVEIISIDSALVYREMNIGTAKPSLAERTICPHHLIDIINPLERYSAARFCQDANQLISDIQARGAIPLVVGGTMLYFKALQQGLSQLPQADAGLRAEIDAEASRHGWPAMHAKLLTLDPTTAARLQPGDTQRIQRALEVCLLTGQPMSVSFASDKPAATDWQSLNLALVPAERSWLHQRIAQRFHWMLEQGFVQEVAQLRADYPALTPALPSMRCVGYRQAWQYLSGEIDRQAMIDSGIAATRQLAKRQLTWLRSLPVLPVNAQAEDSEQRVLLACQHFLAGKTIPPALYHQDGY